MLDSLVNYCFYLKYYFALFFLFFFQTNLVFSEENTYKCSELNEPRDLDELKKLRQCIKKIKIAREVEKNNQIIMNSYEGSSDLTEKIINGNKNSKVSR